MRTHLRSHASRSAAAFTGILLLAFVPVAVGADSTAADGLRAQSGSLAQRAEAATLELYALETQLAGARDDLAALRAQREQVARAQASARAQLRGARAAVRASQRQLEELVRALYQQPGHDPLAVLLGADSLDEALAGLESLDRAAGQTERILDGAREARDRLTAVDAELAARGEELARAAELVEARAAALAAATASRRDFIAGLRRQQDLNSARIASIEREARTAVRRTAALPVAEPAPEPAPAEVVAPVLAPTGERTLTVTSTGYALRGRTATGISTAPGVVAVDPSVIPLGSRLTIPGYGAGVAADTGGAVQGATIDLWFPTTAQALAWGRRTVTVTIH